MADLLKKVVVIDESGEAAGDIPRYRAVKKDGNGKIVLAGDGEGTIGFTTREYESGELVEIVSEGIVPAVIGTAAGVSEGTLLAVGADGKLDAGTAGDPVAAISKGDPGANDDIIKVRVSELLALHDIA